MAFNGLRLEYALEGRSNYISWKDGMKAVLEDNHLNEFIDSDVPKPTSTDVALLDAWQNKLEKTRRILLEGVRYQIVSSLHGKATPYSMWKALTDLFQSSNDYRKLATIFQSISQSLSNVGMNWGVWESLLLMMIW